ncbi:MAG TPA: RDD family protein [Thermoanaerobaculia bacterium]
MFCPSCGVKNDGSPIKCFVCGSIMPSGERAAAADPRRRRSTMSAASEPVAAIGDRMLALILDRVVIVALLSIPAAFLFERWNGHVTAPVRVSIAAGILLLLTILAYHILLEGLFGATLGKGLLGLQVRNGSDDSRWLAATIRNVSRLFDAILFYAFAFLIAAFSTRRQRLGDYLAGTTVIEQRVSVGSRMALIFIWLVIVAGSLWLAGRLCPACFPAQRLF